MLKKEVREYLAMIGRLGGQAGRGTSKLRGGASYYKRISRLAAAARRHAKSRG